MSEFVEGHFHCQIDYAKRGGKKLSATDKFDYNNRLGRWANKHDGPLGFTESGNMPAWAKDDPRKFWEAVDQFERGNGSLYFKAEFALPLDLASRVQQRACAREYVQKLIGEAHPYTLTMHDNPGNPHCDVMWTMRTLDGIERDHQRFFKRADKKVPGRGGCLKVEPSERGPAWVVASRVLWETVANKHLEAAGSNVRIDHRSYKDRGIDKAPGVHLGQKAHRLEMAGKPTWRGIKNREAAHLNASLKDVQSQINRKENGNGQRPRRSGKPHTKQQHRAGVGGTAAAPKRAFTAWGNDRGSNTQGLRSSRRAGPERMPPLRQSSVGDGQQELRNVVLQKIVPRYRDRAGRVHGLSTRRGKHMNTTQITLPPSAATSGIDCGAHPERRQEYKQMLLSEHYNADISQALADQLLYVDRRKDNSMLITLRDEEGNVGGQIHDQGDKMLALSPKVNDAEIIALLELARCRGWSNVTPTGSPEFCKRAAELAAAAGFGVDKAPPPQNALTQSAPASSAESGATTVTSDASSGAAEPERQPTAAEIRWADALLSARDKLVDEQKAARVRLQEIPQVDITKLQNDLAAKHGGDEYKSAMSDYKDAVAAVKNANVFTRSWAEEKKENMQQRLIAVRTKALSSPAAQACIKKAMEHNQEREQIQARDIPINSSIEEINFWMSELRRGVDPEDKFTEAWKKRKLQPLKPWQELTIAQVFTADQARQQAEKEAADAQATQVRKEQAQHEISAQQKADDLLPLLNQPGRSAEQEEALQQEHRFYVALASGCDEAEARERAKSSHLTKVDLPRP